MKPPEQRSLALCFRQGGFTLLELLVVLVVIAVLAAILTPTFQRTVSLSRAASCTSNLRQLGVALTVYLSDHNMVMPHMEGARSNLREDVPVIDNTLDKYLVNKAAFACPGDMSGCAAATGTSYYWNVALNDQPVATLNFMRFTEDHSRIPVLSDKEGFHPYQESKVNILYADGHVTKDLKFWTDIGSSGR